MKFTAGHVPFSFTFELSARLFALSYSSVACFVLLFYFNSNLNLFATGLHSNRCLSGFLSLDHTL